MLCGRRARRAALPAMGSASRAANQIAACFAAKRTGTLGRVPSRAKSNLLNRKRFVKPFLLKRPGRSQKTTVFTHAVMRISVVLASSQRSPPTRAAGGWAFFLALGATCSMTAACPARRQHRRAMCSIKLPVVPRSHGTNARGRRGWLGRLGGQRPRASEFWLGIAASRSREDRWQRRRVERGWRVRVSET